MTAQKSISRVHSAQSLPAALTKFQATVGCLSRTHRNERLDSPAPSGLRLLESRRSGRNRICGQLSPGPQLPAAHHVRNTIRLSLKPHWKGSSHLDNQEHKQGRTVLQLTRRRVWKSVAVASIAASLSSRPTSVQRSQSNGRGRSDEQLSLHAGPYFPKLRVRRGAVPKKAKPNSYDCIRPLSEGTAFSREASLRAMLDLPLSVALSV